MLGLANMSGTWGLGLGTMCQLALSPKPRLHKVFAMQVSMSYLELRTWDSVWRGKSQIPCPQRLKVAHMDL